MKCLTTVSFLLCMVFMVGCAQEGAKVVSISGKVTREGKPYPNVFLNFDPDKGRPSWAQADENGSFVAKYDQTKDGAVVAKHKIWISYRARNPQEEMIEKGFAKGKSSRPKDMNAILEKFGDKEKTPLIIDITKADSNLEIKLD